MTIYSPHYTDIARPLTALTKKNIPFKWTTECCNALDTLITTITEGPMLAQPDMSRPFFLQVDASCNGHYNRTPDLGRYGVWWNTWDLARHTILDTKVLDRNVTWLTGHKDTS